MPHRQFNAHQRSAVAEYGSGQAAVDYILAQRYGGLPSTNGAAPQQEFFGTEQVPLTLQLRYRNLGPGSGR